jgi:hypothetical protein
MTDNWLEDADRSRRARANAPRVQAATTLLQVRGQSPEVAASAARAAQVLGIVPEAVMADPSLERDAQAARDVLELDTAPATARFLADPANAAVAHDQVERLAIMERLLSGAGPATATWRTPDEAAREMRGTMSTEARSRGQSAARTAVGRFIERQGPVGRATANVLRGIGERGAQLGGGFLRTAGTTLDPVNDAVRSAYERVGIPIWDVDRDPTTGRLTVVRGSSARDARQSMASQQFVEGLEQTSAGYVEGTSWEQVKRQPAASIIPFALEQGLISAPDMAAVLVSLPAYVTARTGQIGQTRATNDARDDATVADLLAAMPAATASALLERIGTKGVLGIGERVATRGALAIPAAVGGAALKEGLTEAGQEGIESVGETLGTEAGFNLRDTGERMLAGGLAGVVFGGSVRTATAPLQQHVERQRAMVEAKASILDFDAAAEAIRDNPLMDRAPERLRAFIEGVAGDDDVAIPAERMRSFFQSNPDLEPWLDEWGIRDQYDEAVTSGADITVSKGEYLARIAPTEAHTYFRDDLRLGEGAMTLREAEALEAEGTDRLKTVVSEVTTAVEEQAQVEAPGQAVFDDVFTQLQSAGFTPAVSRQYARVWQARAETRAAALPEVYADAQAAYRAEPLTITQALPDALRNSRDRLDVLIEAVRKGGSRATDRALFGRSLLEMVSSEGGMTDQGGELMAMGADGWHRGRPGKRRLIRPPAAGSTDNRYQADYVIQRAIENGYLPEGSGPNDLFAAIREELAGRPVYANDGSVDLRSEQNRAALDDLEEVLGQLGLDPREATNAEIKAALDTLAADPTGEARGAYDQAGVLVTDSPAFRRWFGDSVVVDENGEPLVVYRGQHGASDDLESRLPSLTFSDAEAASVYAEEPNVRRETPQAPVVYPAYLSIQKPIINDKDDPFMDLSVIDDALGRDVVIRVAAQFADEIEQTGAWADDFSAEFEDVADVIARAPDRLGELPVLAFNILDDATLIEELRAAGYDGAVHAGVGRTFESPEYRVFSQGQVKSVFNNGGFNADDPRILYQSAADSLMAVHNITASKLMNAVKLGGLPVPSLAILRPDMDFTGFGDITLIAPPSLVDPKADRAAKVFASDVYSPRYPRATYQMDNAKRDALSRRLRPAATLVDEDVDLDKVEDDGIEGWADSLRQETILRAAFLMERGDTVEPVMHTGPGFRPGAVDTYATRDALREKVEPLAGEYAAWLEELTAGLVTGERIFDGWTNAGRKKFLPHDLDTVVRILKRSVRDGENWNYGVGSIRSKVTPQFRSLKEMKGKADKLVSKETMDAVKEEADRELIALAERMEGKLQWASPGFGFLDLFSEHLKEAAERRGLSALDAYYNDVTAEDKAAIGGFLAKLADLPTEYFEAKIQRAVGIDEFVGAVVPSDTPAAARKALEDAGLEIREYPRSDNAARIAAVQEFRGSYFQRERGRIDFTSTGRTIRLFKERDLSTFLHESGHAFLEELMGDAALADTLAPDSQVRKDRDAVLQWFGVASADDIGVEQHEQWARATEAYFMEGKAPSLELRASFARFKAWLVAIYRTVARLRTPINDDIRGVMDRLLATEDQIVEAQAKAVHNRLFADAESAGMTQAEFARYTALDAKARAASEDRLMRKVMEPLRKQRTQEYEEAWEKARPANEERIDALPEMQAIEYLRGRPSTERLSRKALVDLYGSDAILKLLPYMRPAMFSDDGGLHPDALAEIVGARNGEELLNLLMQVEAERIEARDGKDRRSVRDIRVDLMTDEDMVEMWGDPFTDGRLEQDALDAVHELQRAEAMASEANVLARQAGVEGLWTVEAMQDYATRSVAGLLARKVRPASYLRAERAAGNEAQAAFAAQRFDDALDAKLRQNVNFHLYRAAVDAEAQITKANELFGRVMAGREQDVARYRNMDMVYAARGVLSAFNVARWDQNAAEYMAKLREYDPDTWAVLEPYVAGATMNAKPVVDLTYREFTEMAAVVKQLWEMSRRSKVVEIDGRKMELEKVTGELTITLLDTGPPKFGEIGKRQAVTDQEKRLNGLMGLGALVTKVEEWSARKGPEFTKYIWTPVSKAADDYRAARREYIPQLLDALKSLRPDMAKPFKIDAPELGYVFGANRGAGLAELLGALRHTGNESNLRKLLLGREWASERPDGSLDTTRWDAFLARKHADGTITKVHWDYIQAEWDLHEAIKPMAQRAHRAMYGRYFSEVTAQPVVTPFGVYKGGYVAAAPDPDIDARAQERQAEGMLEGPRSGTFTFPGPANGFTKSRVEYNTALDLDLRKAVSQMDQVLRFAFIGPAARDVNRILADRVFANTLRQYDPNAWLGVLLPWLERTVTMRTTTPSRSKGGQFFDTVVAQIGRNTGMSIMFGSIVNTVQQVTGFGPAALRTGKMNMAQALGVYLKDPAGVTKSVRAASKLMADRADTQMQEVADAANAIVLNPNLYEKGVRWTEQHAYFMQHGFQNVMDPIVWLAAREKGVQEKMDDPEGFADSVIRSTQGSRNPEDITAFSTGPKWASPFKAFTSYFIDQANLLDTEWRKAGSIGRRAEIYALGFLIPAAFAKLLAEALSGRLDGEDGWGDEAFDILILSQVQYALAMVPLFGQAANLTINRFDGKVYNDRLSVAPFISTLETVTRVPYDFFKLAKGTGDASDTTKDVLTAVAMTAGLPTPTRQAGYVVDVAEGDVEPSGPVDAVRGFATGTASEGTRQ